MALSAPTYRQPLNSDHTRLGKIVVADFTFDSSYSIGGEAVDVTKQFGFSEVWYVSIDQILPVATTGYVFRYDYTNNKIVAFWVDTSTDGAPMAEVVDTTDLSTVKVRVFAYGF